VKLSPFRLAIESPPALHDTTAFRLLRVDSRPRQDQIVLSPPYPKAAIKSALGSRPACLKGARKGQRLTPFGRQLREQASKRMLRRNIRQHPKKYFQGPLPKTEVRLTPALLSHLSKTALRRRHCCIYMGYPDHSVVSQVLLPNLVRICPNFLSTTQHRQGY
jgi:hypothetical protein